MTLCEVISFFAIMEKEVVMVDGYVEDIGYLYDLADIVLITDKEGKIEYYKVFRSIGTTLIEDPVGMHILDKHQHLSASSSTVMRVIQKGEPIINEKQTLNLFKERTVEVLTSTFPIRSGEEVVGVIEIDRYHDPDLRRSPPNRRKDVSSPNNVYFTIDDVVTGNKQMKELLRKTKRAARTSSPVMIWGETGTGKELIAQSIHNHSYRTHNPFVAQNCSAIPLTLGESIFFGTTKGSFTGAEEKIGLFEMAHKGTLVLDEINSMDINLQSKLLRATESRSIRKIGGSDSVGIDVRLVTTLNEEPLKAVELGKLRRDLFYRLSVILLEIPPLRHRRDDIPLLVDYFVEGYNQQMNAKIKGIDKQVMEAFMSYAWPGNVRELKHAIESAFNFAEGEYIGLDDVPSYLFAQEKVPSGEFDLNRALKEFEVGHIVRALKGSDSLKAAAEKLKISRQSLRYKIDTYSIEEEYDQE